MLLQGKKRSESTEYAVSHACFLAKEKKTLHARNISHLLLIIKHSFAFDVEHKDRYYWVPWSDSRHDRPNCINTRLSCSWSLRDPDLELTNKPLRNAISFHFGMRKPTHSLSRSARSFNSQHIQIEACKSVRQSPRDHVGPDLSFIWPFGRRPMWESTCIFPKIGWSDGISLARGSGSRVNLGTHPLVVDLIDCFGRALDFSITLPVHVGHVRIDGGSSVARRSGRSHSTYEKRKGEGKAECHGEGSYQYAWQCKMRETPIVFAERTAKSPSQMVMWLWR